MSKNEPVDAETVRSGLAMLLEHFEALRQADSIVAFYTLIADKLSKMVGREDPWTWRYVQGVHKGTIAPSPIFARAVFALGAAIDEVPVTVIDTEAVQVYARKGLVKPRSVVLAASKPCANPACPVQFVPKVPWQKFCSDECRNQVASKSNHKKH
jgi:hypothetical protein